MLPKRIAHVISARGVGGAERFLNLLVQEGAARGWDQLVLNPFANQQSTEFAELLGSVAYRSAPCDTLPELVRLRSWLQSELTDFGPSLEHILLFHALVASAAIPRRPGVPRVATNVYGEGLRVGKYPRVREPLDRWAGRRADLTIAISESVARFLVEQYRYPADKVVCLPLGWEGTPLPRRPADAPTVVCVAKYRAEKGHFVLLRAIAIVRDVLPAVRLILVGDGNYRHAIEQKIADLDLGSQVVLTGSVDQIWPYLAQAHVFALASLTEAYGIAVAEAMAAGVPVVAAAVGGIPELVEPGVTGELFPPGDAEAMAGHLIRLLTSPETVARMGRAAKIAAEPLAMGRSVRRYADLIEGLASEGMARTPADSSGKDN